MKLKLGFNPNSSSIGTVVFVMPAALIGLTIIFGAAAGIMSSAYLHHRAATGRGGGRAASDGEEPRSESGDPERESSDDPTTLGRS